MLEQQNKFANETAADDRFLPEPHFEDEATLLSARPVIPLHELRAQTNSSRRLVFSVTTVVALVLGALGGIFYVGFKDTVLTPGEKVQQASPASAQHDIVPTSTEAGAADTASNEPKVLVVEKHERSTSSQVRHSNASMAVKRPAPRGLFGGSGGSGALSTVGVHQNGLADLEYERELRRARRREARRLRRRAREQAQPSNDLFRIREIFEGSPRE